MSAKNQDSSGACNADANSLKYDVNHMCGGRKTELLYVSHASYCGETVSKGKTSGPPTIRWKNAKPVRFLFSFCFSILSESPNEKLTLL